MNSVCVGPSGSMEGSTGGGFYRGLDGRLDKEVRTGSSTGVSMESSTGELVRGFFRGVLPRAARYISETGVFTGGLDGRLDRGALPGAPTEDSIGGARPGSSTGGSMEGSTGELVPVLDRGVLPKGLDTHVLQ